MSNTQIYLLIDTTSNICDNVVAWDGDVETWQPPQGHLALLQADVFANIWKLNALEQWELTPVQGAGSIGFTWDGAYLTTNEPQPAPTAQPITEGTQEL